MKRDHGVPAAALGALIGLLAVGAQAAPPPPSPAAPAAPAAGAPSEESLRILDRLAGRWTMDVSQFVRGRPPVHLAGTSENTWILGRRFLQCASAAGEGEERSDALTTFGYDPRNGEYFAVAVATSAAPYLSLHGAYYDSSRSFVLRGEDSSSTGVRFKRRYVIRLESADRYVVEGFIEYPGANPVQQFEIVYTRS